MYTDNSDIREIHLGVLQWSHFTHSSCTTPLNNNSKLKMSEICLVCKNLITSHHLFLHKSPLTMTNYVDTEIRDLFLDVLNWGHCTNTSCITPPKNNTKLKISKITSLYRHLVVDHHLFLPRSPLCVSVTKYIDTEITELGLDVLNWGHFTHTSCTTSPKNTISLNFQKFD